MRTTSESFAGLTPAGVQTPRSQARGSSHAPARGFRRGRAPWVAIAALLTGALYVVVSLYWALGGRFLLATVGRSLVDQHSATHSALTAAVWAAIAIKLIATVVPLIAVRQGPPRRWVGAARIAAWAEGAILIAYGFVLTSVGLLVQAGAISASRHADTKALAWHAYFWDPWFLVWGLLVVLTLRTAGIRLRRPS